MEYENDDENDDASKTQNVFLFSKKLNTSTEFIF